VIRRIRLESLRRQPYIDRVVVISLTPSLYTLRVFIGKSEYLVLDHGATVRRPNAESIKQLFLGCNVGEYRLFHQSPYDEMIGLPDGGANLLDVPTGAPLPGAEIVPFAPK
jgi:hypothetical protein